MTVRSYHCLSLVDFLQLHVPLFMIFSDICIHVPPPPPQRRTRCPSDVRPLRLERERVFSVVLTTSRFTLKSLESRGESNLDGVERACFPFDSTPNRIASVKLHLPIRRLTRTSLKSEKYLSTVRQMNPRYRRGTFKIVSRLFSDGYN